MSISSEITRIINAKQDIKSSLYTYNIDVSNNTLDKYGSIINPTLTFNDITPYNLNYITYDSSTKIMGFQSNANRFCVFNSIDITKQITFSFKFLTTIGSAYFQIGFYNNNTPHAFDSINDIYFVRFLSTISALQVYISNNIVGRLNFSTTIAYHKIQYKNNYITYYDSPDSITWTLRGTCLFPVSNANYLCHNTSSVSAVQISNFKFSQH